MTVISASSLPAGYIKIGAQEFGDDVPARCVVTIKKLVSKVKLDKKAVDGKSDGTTTNKGRDPADVEVSLVWNSSNADVDAAVEEALYQLSPRGPNSGQPMDVAFKRSRVAGVDKVIVEEVEGPIDTAGDDKSTATIKCASWTKPAPAGQGASKTATTATPMVVKGFGSNNNTITYPAPKVTP